MGEIVSFPVDGGTAEGYLASPSGDRGPGVVVLSGWWGLIGQVKSVADRLADEGFVALAPDIYHGEVASDPEQAQQLADDLSAGRVGGELVGAASYLAGSGRVGALGFGLGGSLALWAATLSPDVVAAASFYPLTPWRPEQPDWARLADKAVVLHIADEDAPDLQEARKSIEAAGAQLTAYEYPGTRRMFFNDDRPDTYDPIASGSAWARTIAVFRDKLV